MKRAMRVSVVVPVYNSESVLAELAARLRRLLEGRGAPSS